jgi:anti-sigma B factor antagonist
MPDFQVEYHDGMPVVRVSGDVDVGQATKLRDRLLEELSNQDTGLVIDLTGTSYLDSAGVNMLFEVAERLAAGQLRFAIVVPEESLVERVLKIVDMASVAELRGSLDSALAAARGGEDDESASSSAA